MIDQPVQIMNLALRHLAVATLIGEPTERSPAAEACRAFYDQAVEETMSEFQWTFGSKTLPLVELVGPDMTVPQMPTPEWTYAYQYPVEAIHVRRLFSALNQSSPGQQLWAGSWASGWPWNWDSTQWRLPYKISQNPNQPGTLWLLCNWPSVWAEITVSNIPTQMYGAKLALALSYRLGQLHCCHLDRGGSQSAGPQGGNALPRKNQRSQEHQH